MRPRAPRDLEYDPREPTLDRPHREPVAADGGPGDPTLEGGVAYARKPRRFGLWLLLLLVAVALVWFFFPGPPEAELSDLELDFGTVRVGRSSEEAFVSVTNRGERKLRIETLSFAPDTAGDFQIVDGDCPGAVLATGESCSLTLRFEPRQAGDRSTRLAFEGNDRNQPGLSVTAVAIAPKLGFAPSSVSFGVVPLEADRVSRKVTLSNVGSAALRFSQINIAGAARADFSRSRRCPSSTLEPGEACSFEIRFAPSVSGERVAELVVESDVPAGRDLLALTGTGLWEGPPLDAATKTLKIGEQLVGERSPARIVELVNRTGGTVSVDRTSVEGSSSFAVVEDQCKGRAVASGASCTIAVTFLPVKDGADRATLSLAAAGASEQAQVALTGRGVTPKLEVAASALDFEQQRVGFESAARKVTLRNTGTATLKLDSVSMAGPQASEFLLVANPCAAKPLGPGKSCAISVAFNPAKLGGREGALEIEPGYGLGTSRVALSGEGVVSALAVRPGSLDFGSVYLGRVEEKVLTLTNEGSASLLIRGLRFEGSDAAAFGLDQSECPLEAGLAPGASCRLRIGFEPEAERRYGSQLVVAYNGPDSPAKVELRAAARAPAPIFRISADDLDLGSADVGGRGEIGTLVVSNPGAAWLSLNGIAIRGDHAEDFQLVAGTCDGVTALAPDGSCTIGVRLAPSVAGRRRGAIVVRHGGASGTATVNLRGQAVPQPVLETPAAEPESGDGSS